MNQQEIREALQEHSPLPLLPLKNIVLLPKTIIPIIVGRQSSINAVKHALKESGSIFVTAQKNASIEQPENDDLYHFGTRGTVLQVMRMPKDTIKVLIEGVSRARITKFDTNENFTFVECEDVPTTNRDNSVELTALWRHLKSLYQTYAQLNNKASEDIISSEDSISDIEAATDTLAVHCNLGIEERQEVLELVDLKERLLLLCTILQKEIDILETEERIRGHVQSQIEKSQREYYLTEQMKAIQKELGRDDQQTEINEMREKTDTLCLTEEAHEKVERELKRLEQMPPLSSESIVNKNYIEWILSLPWYQKTDDRLSLKQAENLLDKQHAGLKGPKERIIEFLATKKFSPSTMKKSPIICLVGPPGVGKTSLASSVAEALGREFIRLSLGGVRDEAEIRGHRRTYIGSMPGRIIQSMRKAKTINPVILLDEIDKLSSDAHGDPASALLEALDPEQNKSFTDNYLEVGYDLSKVIFITTANHMDGIPYPLLDRMEIIELSGYTQAEKLDIATKFLLPKNLSEHGLTAEKIKVPKRILKMLINEYTREAGVRQLERLIAKIMRKSIQVFLKEKDTKTPYTIKQQQVIEWLGTQPFQQKKHDIKAQTPGVATGLAWTEFGGDILEIEATTVPGKGNVTLTGQLGSVMQESAHAAISYIRSRAEQLNIDPSFHNDKDIHIHVPEGATPKDGPSAGITIATALISSLTDISLKPAIAMTGEITLRGRVLAVGGLKEKLLAARQHGIDHALLPKENKASVEEVIKEIQEDAPRVTFVEHLDEVLSYALQKTPFDAH